MGVAENSCFLKSMMDASTNAQKTNRGKDKCKQKDKRELQWTDNKAELQLNVTFENKTAKAVDKVDWESVKNKYEIILEHFRAELPIEQPSPAEEEFIDCGLTKNYPHVKEEVTK